MKKGEDGFRAFGSVLDRPLEGREWLVGDRLSLADISVEAYLMQARQVRMPIEPYRRIQHWYARIEALEAWQKSAPRMG